MRRSGPRFVELASHRDQEVSKQALVAHSLGHRNGESARPAEVVDKVASLLGGAKSSVLPLGADYAASVAQRDCTNGRARIAIAVLALCV